MLMRFETSWLLSFIPCIVTASTGGYIIEYLPLKVRGAILVVSFLLWSLGISMCMIITTIYFWRLVRYKLPARDAIVSSFIPMGPPGMGAFGIQNLAVALASYITTKSFDLSRDEPQLPNTAPGNVQSEAFHLAVAGAIHWVGVVVALFLTSFSTFWLLQGVLSVGWRVPKTFNVGFWAFVFPNAVYSNSLCRLALDLNNRGLRGWAATMVVVTTLLWLLCTAGTLWKSVWKGELLFAPGLEGWNEKKALQEEEQRRRGLASGIGNGIDGSRSDVKVHERRAVSAGDAELLDELVVTRDSRPDGTYAVMKEKRRRGRRQSGRRIDGEMV